MGILDFLKKDNKNKESEISVSKALDKVKDAARNSDYNEATINAFYAIEAQGRVFANLRREEAQTAREYVKLLDENYNIDFNVMRPLIETFEIAKYSPLTVNSEQFSEVDQVLNQFSSMIKQVGTDSVKQKGKKKMKRRKPRKRVKRRPQ